MNKLSWQTVDNLTGWLVKLVPKNKKERSWIVLVLSNRQVKSTGHEILRGWVANTLTYDNKYSDRFINEGYYEYTDQEQMQNAIDVFKTGKKLDFINTENFNIQPLQKVFELNFLEPKQTLSRLDFEKESIDAEDTLRGSILDSYNTIIFDLDLTLWNCFTLKGESIGAYQTKPPYRLQDKLTIEDIKGNIIQLQEGVREILDMLDLCNKNLGIISRGEKLVEGGQGLSFDAQPSTMLLKKFDIFKYFNYNIVYKHDIQKGDYIHPQGKTLFIDNQREIVEEVNKRGDVDVLWRGSFNNWKELLGKQI